MMNSQSFSQAGSLGRTLGFRVVLAAVAGPLLCGACAPDEGELRMRLESYDPAVRIRAINTIAGQGEAGLTAALVDRLDDEDAAVRFFAILALEKLTGTRLGYSYAAPPNERRAAVEVWRRYIARSAAADEGGTAATAGAG